MAGCKFSFKPAKNKRGVVRKLLASIFFTILVAVGIAVLQILVKAVSRWRRLMGQSGSITRLTTRDDWLFWHEWEIAAGFALGFFVVRNSIANQATSPKATIALIALMILGLLIVPAAIGGLVYDSSSGNTKGWRYIGAANVIGLAFLIVVVIVGVNVYG